MSDTYFSRKYSGLGYALNYVRNQESERRNQIIKKIQDEATDKQAKAAIITNRDSNISKVGTTIASSTTPFTFKKAKNIYSAIKSFKNKASENKTEEFNETDAEMKGFDDEKDEGELEEDDDEFFDFEPLEKPSLFSRLKNAFSSSNNESSETSGYEMTEFEPTEAEGEFNIDDEELPVTTAEFMPQETSQATGEAFEASEEVASKPSFFSNMIDKYINQPLANKIFGKTEDAPETQPEINFDELPEFERGGEDVGVPIDPKTFRPISSAASGESEAAATASGETAGETTGQSEMLADATFQGNMENLKGDADLLNEWNEKFGTNYRSFSEINEDDFKVEDEPQLADDSEMFTRTYTKPTFEDIPYQPREPPVGQEPSTSNVSEATSNVSKASPPQAEVVSSQQLEAKEGETEGIEYDTPSTTSGEATATTDTSAATADVSTSASKVSSVAAEGAETGVETAAETGATAAETGAETSEAIAGAAAGIDAAAEAADVTAAATSAVPIVDIVTGAVGAVLTVAALGVTIGSAIDSAIKSKDSTSTEDTDAKIAAIPTRQQSISGRYVLSGGTNIYNNTHNY